MLFLYGKSLFQTNGRRLNQAIPILSCATSRSLNTTKPFFINMKELPQMNAKESLRPVINFFGR